MSPAPRLLVPWAHLPPVNSPPPVPAPHLKRSSSQVPQRHTSNASAASISPRTSTTAYPHHVTFTSSHFIGLNRICRSPMLPYAHASRSHHRSRAGNRPPYSRTLRPARLRAGPHRSSTPP